MKLELSFESVMGIIGALFIFIGLILFPFVPNTGGTLALIGVIFVVIGIALYFYRLRQNE